MKSNPDQDPPTTLETTQASLQVQEDPRATAPPAPLAPGDEVSRDAVGSAEGLCRACGGSGRNAVDGFVCPVCEGGGKVSVGIGGG
jgi:hypothetical protein